MGKKKTRNDSPAFMGFYFYARNEDGWLHKHVTPRTDGLQNESEVWRQEKPEIGRHKLTCRMPGSLFKKENYNVRVLLVENWTRVKTILEYVVGFDVKNQLQG